MGIPLDDLKFRPCYGVEQGGAGLADAASDLVPALPAREGRRYLVSLRGGALAGGAVEGEDLPGLHRLAVNELNITNKI